MAATYQSYGYSNGYQQQPPPVQIARQFPPAFSMYRASTWGKSYMLGVHQSQPLYAIALHSGWSGEPNVILHSGPDEKQYPPLASVDRSMMSRDSTITLPGPLGSGRTSIQEQVEFSGWPRGKQSWSIEVDATGRREFFEWRHSHGYEIDALGGRGQGWKLLRLASDGAYGGGTVSSDGKEVVAVWANAGMSTSKIFNFQFMGSGASGVLGERWAIMAVITALQLWDKQRRANNGAVAGAAAAS